MEGKVVHDPCSSRSSQPLVALGLATCLYEKYEATDPGHADSGTRGPLRMGYTALAVVMCGNAQRSKWRHGMNRGGIDIVAGNIHANTITTVTDTYKKIAVPPGRTYRHRRKATFLISDHKHLRFSASSKDSLHVQACIPRAADQAKGGRVHMAASWAPDAMVPGGLVPPVDAALPPSWSPMFCGVGSCWGRRAGMMAKLTGRGRLHPNGIDGLVLARGMFDTLGDGQADRMCLAALRERGRWQRWMSWVEPGLTGRGWNPTPPASPRHILHSPFSPVSLSNFCVFLFAAASVCVRVFYKLPFLAPGGSRIPRLAWASCARAPAGSATWSTRALCSEKAGVTHAAHEHLKPFQS